MRQLLLACLLVCMYASSAAAQVTPDFAGLGFGLGLQVHSSMRSDLVNPEDVTVDENGFLHVDRLHNVDYGMVFESHVTFQWRPSIAVGPYFSITPGRDQDQLIEAVGLGVLFELNRPTLNPVTNRFESSPVSFNIGVGINVLFNATLLRDGFADGLPVPLNSGNPTITRERLVFGVITTIGFG